MFEFLITFQVVTMLIAVFYAIKSNKINKKLKALGRSIKIKKSSGVPSAKTIRIITNLKGIKRK